MDGMTVKLRKIDLKEDHISKNMAGLGGFEPPHDGIKTRCLTAWLQPINAIV